MSLQNTTASRLCLQAAGGCLQHAKGLLSMLAADAGHAAEDLSPAAGRSVSTTRSVSMGRVVMNERLKKSATPSQLYTKENYKALVSQGFSLDAAEEVLNKHKAAKQHRRNHQHQQQQGHWQRQNQQRVDKINAALNARINACSSLAELRSIIEQEAHNMTPINMAVVIQRAPKVLLSPDGQADFTAAALLLDHMAHMIQPHLHQLSDGNIVTCLGAFLKCRYTPSAEMLQGIVTELTYNNNYKLHQMNLQNLGHLLLSLNKITLTSTQWPLQQSILEIVTERLQLLNGTRKQTKRLRQPHPLEAERNANSIAQLASLLERNKLHSHEYIKALHEWVAEPGNLRKLSANASSLLWTALKSQFAAHALLLRASEQQDAATDPSSSSSSTEPPAAADGAAQLQDEQAVVSAASSSSSSEVSDSVIEGSAGDHDHDLQKHQADLVDFFGPRTLDNLAAATVQLISGMTEKELGIVLACLGSLRYYNYDLLAAAAVGMDNMYKAAASSSKSNGMSILTCVSAGWAAAMLQQPNTSLLLPLLVAAVERPGDFDGLAAGRLLRLTQILAAQGGDIIEQQRQQLRAEIHKRTDRRGPVPDGSSSSVPEWVTAIADSLPDRLYEFKPREVAHILEAYSSLPGVEVHSELFAAAARHIEAHAHTFTQCKDMELVATAFERMNYKEGLPALKALQQQSESLAISMAQ